MVRYLISVAVASVLSCDIFKPANSSGTFRFAFCSINTLGNLMSTSI